MKTKTFKPGDYCRFTPEEIPSIIDLLKANGWKVLGCQENCFTEADNCIYFNQDGYFCSMALEDISRPKSELSRHDFLVTTLRLNEGDGLRDVDSTIDQRFHILSELKKLGVNTYDNVTFDDEWKNLGFIKGNKDESEIVTAVIWNLVRNAIPYSEWCKRLNVEPINHLPDVGEKVDSKPSVESFDTVSSIIESLTGFKPSPADCYGVARITEICEMYASHMKNTLTLPDGTTVDLTKPIQGLFDGAWFDVSKYIGMSTENEFVCEIHDVFDTPFTEFKHIRNKPEPEFKLGDKVWYSYKNDNGLPYYHIGTYSDHGDIIDQDGEYVLAKVKIRPAFIDGKPVYPPFND